MSVHSTLHRYWVRFNNPTGTPFGLGVGVTAFTREDALSLVRDVCFEGGEPLPIADIKDDVSLAELDAGHVVPNMHPITERGVWFPKMRPYS